MEVTIGLARAHYEKLRHDVSKQARAYAVLHRSPQLERWAGEKPSRCA